MPPTLHNDYLPENSFATYVSYFMPMVFLYAMKMSIWFSDLFRGYRKTSGMSFTIVEYFFKLTFTPWYAHANVRLGIRNVIFSENFAYILNGWFVNRFVNVLYRKLLHIIYLFTFFINTNLFIDYVRICVYQ